MIELDYKKTPRKQCFEAFIDAPMPMLTAFKKINVTKAVSLAKRKGLKLNGVLCYAIGKAAAKIPEFHYVIKERKLFYDEKFNVSVVVRGKNGEFLNCDVPFTADATAFHSAYCELVKKVYDTGESHDETSGATIGTSTVLTGSFDGLVNLYSPQYLNPFLVWARYEKTFFGYFLNFSFQFHHAQMDGGEAAAFLSGLEQAIRSIPADFKNLQSK